LEWPPTLSGGESFVVLRGDDGRTYYVDVISAQRHVQGALSAGTRVALLGLEGTKPHEIIAVALGSGDAAALALAVSQATAPPPAPGPAVPPALPPPPPAPPPARLEEGQPTAIHGIVTAIMGPTLFLQRDDGQILAVDISKQEPSTRQRLTRGQFVTVLGVPFGKKFQATGLVQTEPGVGGSTPGKPAR